MLINKREGIHLFLNPFSDEIHYFFQKFGEDKPDKYSQNKDGNFNSWFGRFEIKDFENDKNQPKITKIAGNNLKIFIEKIGLKISGDIEKNEALFLPFNFREINLGVFVIWGERNLRKKYKPSENIILGWISNWYSFLSDIFKRDFGVNKRTYLPYHYNVGWKRVAILFADIRNFTPLTEILRNRSSYGENTSETLREIVNDFCSEMSKIIQEKNRGRIDKFIGDEIMVLFGEYDHHPSKIVCEAIYVATKMIKKFEDLKKGWQNLAFGGAYEIEFNESVEIDLGIGIDFGRVLFDVLGDEGYFEYSAVGDHVNFASRLQGMAAKEDEKTGEKNPHIIISSTAFRCCRPWLKKFKKIKLNLKGKSYQYDCYGIEPDDLDEQFFFTSEACNDWESAWKGYELESPDALKDI